MKEPLTKPQKSLLDEMRASSSGGLYVRRWGRYWRTATALVRKGYAKQEYVDNSSDWFEAVSE